MIGGIVFDLDGVLRVGTKPVPGANEAIGALLERKIPFMICTNECRYTPNEIVSLLRSMNIAVPETTPIFTAALAIKLYLQHKIARGEENLMVGIVGEQGLHNVLSDGISQKYIFDDPQSNTENQKRYLIVGTLNQTDPILLDKIRKWIHAGAVVITSCCDVSDPSTNTAIRMPNQLLQMCGYSASMAYSTGKPNPLWARAIRANFSPLPDKNILFVGDTLYTDIRLAEESGFRSALVLSGNSTRECLLDSVVSPDYVIDSVADVTALL